MNCLVRVAGDNVLEIALIDPIEGNACSRVQVNQSFLEIENSFLNLLSVSSILSFSFNSNAFMISKVYIFMTGN